MNSQPALFNESNITTEVTDPFEQAAMDWLMNYARENTRQNYRRACVDFFASSPKHPQTVNQTDVIQYRYMMEERGYSPSTINQRLSGISSYFRFLVERGLLKDNPCDGVKRHPVNPYGKATFLDGQKDEDMKLLEQIDTSTVQGKRDYAIILLFLTTAVRVDAVAGLKMKDLRLQSETVFLTYVNKGGDEVEKKLHPVTVTALRMYLDCRGELTDDSPVFVMSDWGKQALRNLTGDEVDKERPLTSRSIQRMVRKYADHAFGKGHSITPHSLRHSAAMNAIQSGASVIEVSRLLRHKNMRVTTIYIQHVNDKADDVVSEKLDRRYG